MQRAYSEVYAITECRNAIVKDCWGSDGWDWCKILGNGAGTGQDLNSTLSEFKEQIYVFKVDQNPDRILCHWKPGGCFLVKSAYSTLSERGMRDARAIKLWRLCIPLKVKIFYQLVLTADNLIKKGVDQRHDVCYAGLMRKPLTTCSQIAYSLSSC